MYNNSWFTVEALENKTFSISEYGHWEEPHCYLFIGSSKAALVDTGLGIGKISHIVQNLTSKPVLVVTTHCHWDHIGGHGEFKNIAIHKNDKAWLETGLPIPISVVRNELMKEALTQETPNGFNPKLYCVHTGSPMLVLEDGDSIDLGGRSLHVLHTPGHSPGHICLFEEKSGYLCTGDLLYKGVIHASYPSTDPVMLRNSIMRINTLSGITRLLPGHHSLQISKSILQTAITELNRINDAGLLKHGSGLHKCKDIDFSF